ncbi:thyrotroph embryonic factor isoform X1 [Tursiops truncatus]|uniref:Thyrotroph embryonic factor isoform X1 n=2 Tax=Tursiops truncatus TaxID=9739 RepID=A0A6J3S4M7_TURTR|nr:thyrotroph embryonic factor isoform X2 [Globicephala melas]XP_033721850.1 thyrotroph embryonic factor isoform X1 [Tursiops truncatus]
MSDAGGGKKPPVEPQAGPGPGPGRAAGERGLPGSFPLVLKKLMENPPREARLDKEKGKEKLEEDEAAAASTMAVSASLMPPIWDKTIPYDGESFHLEYMDLDEFLLENGIPASPTHLAQNLLLPVAELEGKESASSSTASPPSSSTAVFQPSETVSSTESSLEKERETPSPIDPNCVEVDVNFNPDPADLVLSSVPGGELFNPRKHKFAEEDLKPQPMIKKAKKVFVPDEQKVTWCIHCSEGRKVLDETQEEQRGGQAVSGRPAPEGEPDHHPGGLPGEGEHSPADGGGGAAQGGGQVQDHRVQVRDQVRALVTRAPTRARCLTSDLCLGPLKPTPAWRLMTRRGRMAVHLPQEPSRSSFIITWPARQLPWGPASSLAGCERIYEVVTQP